MSSVLINDEFLANHLLEDLRETFIGKKHASDVRKLDSLLTEWLEKGRDVIVSSTEPSASTITSDFHEMVDICATIYPLLLKLLCKPLDTFDNSDCGALRIAPSVLDITKRSKSLIKVLLEGQDFAFQSKDLRRDNIIHQFRVFLLGYYLITQYGDFLVDFLASDIEQTPVGPLGSKKKATVLYVWTLASLFHDCGRGIQTYFELHKELAEPKFKNIFKTYGLKPSRVLPPTINKFIENNPKWKASKKTFFSLLELTFSRMRGVPQKLYYGDVEKPLRDALTNKASHAVISAFLLIHPEAFRHYEALQRLTATLADDSSEDTLEDGYAARDPRLIQQEACLADLVPYLMLPFCGAVATAFHATVDRWFMSPFTQFLTICDNLQEWERLTKVGDQFTKIFPCKQIEIEVTQLDTDTLEAIIKVKYEANPSPGKGCSRGASGPPLPYPTHLEVLRNRWDPEKRWKKIKGDIGKHVGSEIYGSLHKKGISLKISILRGELLRVVKIPKR